MGPVDKAVIIFGVVTVGVGMILYLESRKTPTHTGPALTVIPSSEADLSTITNMTNALTAYKTLGHPAMESPTTSAPAVGVN